MLKIENLTICAVVSGETVTIIDGLFLELAPGSHTALIGESGSGKSMLAMAILGLLPENVAVSGEIKFCGTELCGAKEKVLNEIRGKKIVLVPQGGHDYLNPSLKIGVQLKETLKKIGVKTRLEREKRAVQLIQAVGFDEADRILESYPHQLSGGMAQKVLLSVAIAGDPDLVICDEPTRGVDSDAAKALIKLIKDLMPRAAILLITHDLNIASMCEKTVIMLEGEVMEVAENNTFPAQARSEYAKALLAAMPRNGLNPIKKLTEQRSNGCGFALYCPKSQEICFERNAELKNIESGFLRCHF